ncbi:hypothetical protein [Micromonospora sp. WMMD1082]|uniref:hypothetical protein n=1 Tax=Micromonospora sp. WMMD1082 TaxID=3016104 RepID=UPI002417A35E|nr:hypothetical protein [Micromonospora sp. WMMD1082]MDG4793544.1 hypothetical protein [Micromonospora sp. WMMD1082]
MTTPRPGPAPDDAWRRPDTGDGSTSGAPSGRQPAPDGTPRPTGAAGYGGPPPTTAPPPGWRPPVHVQPAPPRQLPAQDMVALDAQEQRAQRVTWIIGAVAGAVLLILGCLLCTRALF